MFRNAIAPAVRAGVFAEVITTLADRDPLILRSCARSAARKIFQVRNPQSRPELQAAAGGCGAGELSLGKMSHRFSNGNASPQLRIGFAGRMTFEIPADEFVTFRLSQDEKSIATGFGFTHMPTVVSRATGSVLGSIFIDNLEQAFA